MAREEARRRRTGRGPASLPFWTAPRRALLTVAVVAVLFADDRHVGKVGDSLQMIRTSVALATVGEIGVSGGIHDSHLVRDEGDATTRYGLGMSLAQLPAAFAAPSVERAFGPGGSQSLFLLAPIAFGLLAAWAAGRIAVLLGAGMRGAGIAVLLASVGSPMASYMTTDLSETLQAAALAFGLLASLESRRHAGRAGALRWAAAAGLACGVAVLTKPVLFGVAPFVLLPLLGRSSGSPGAGVPLRLALAAAGSAPALAAWLWLEVARFGLPFGGYAGFGFTYPFLLGAAQLLAGPVKGIFLFFPALALALVEAGRRLGMGNEAKPEGDRGAVRLETAACLLPLGVLLAVASCWWSWSGFVGWGPRLLVPGIPGAAALAATAIERWRVRPARVLVGVSIALNALALLQSPVPVFQVVRNLAPVDVTPRIASRFIPNPVPGADGRFLIPGAQVIHEEPLASDLVTHAWMIRVRLAPDEAGRARRLDAVPWLSRRPDLVSLYSPYPRSVAAALAPPFSVGFLGRSLLGGTDPARGDAYTRALGDQVLRALQQRRLDRALRLGELLLELRPRPDSAAIVAETYRLLGRHETLRAFLDALPRELRGSPHVLAVVALAARDVGEVDAARAYLEQAAVLDRPAIRAALKRPVAEWPRDFVSLLGPAETTP